jgi:hypothetical protein
VLGAVEEEFFISIYVRMWGIRITLSLVAPSVLNYEGDYAKVIPVEV